MTIAGIVAGLLAAAGLGRILTGLLFGVRPMDPTTLGTVAALFIVVSGLATLLPAWRAMRVDPAAALRHD
jgi:putative ABC transport system permease protein